MSCEDLYDLARDRGETNDRFCWNPEVLARMTVKYAAWVNEMGISVV